MKETLLNSDLVCSNIVELTAQNELSTETRILPLDKCLVALV